TSPARPIRVLEFGCGGGMNIIALVALLIKKGIPIERAYGTDFSPTLVETAGQDAKASLPPGLVEKLSFHIARTERLVEGLTAAAFEILKKENFCWIPHSAGRALTLGCRLLSPVLNLLAPSRAMRSLVVARKPV